MTKLFSGVECTMDGDECDADNNEMCQLGAGAKGTCVCMENFKNDGTGDCLPLLSKLHHVLISRPVWQALEVFFSFSGSLSPSILTKFFGLFKSSCSLSNSFLVI